jgi:hypothetical protein
MLDIVGFGVLLGRGTQAGELAGIFGFAYILFGSLIGAGFVLSREATGPSSLVAASLPAFQNAKRAMRREAAPSSARG